MCSTARLISVVSFVGTVRLDLDEANDSEGTVYYDDRYVFLFMMVLNYIFLKLFNQSSS